MKVEQMRWETGSGWNCSAALSNADLVLVFADTPFFRTAECYEQIRAMYPRAHILGCSSSGSVLDTEISDDDVVLTAVQLEKAQIRVTQEEVSPTASGQEIGRRLVEALQAEPGLKHVFVLSDGLQVNGSALAQGLGQGQVSSTGGLAGDGSRFAATSVMCDAMARPGLAAAVGFYGPVTVRSGCFSGWEEFGAERLVTRSVNNVVYEIDGQPALALYKKYLGDLASDLPASGLRFPLSVQANMSTKPVIRTLLAVDEAAQSLTFAGDVPQGHLCKLMKSNMQMLIDNAGRAAESARAPDAARGLCLAVSCVGRRLVMGQMTEEELEVVRDTLGGGVAITGFYSYGELAPFSELLQCQLHNQTMTLTAIYE